MDDCLIPRETMSAEWKKRAACRGLDAELFYPTKGVSAAEAVAVCRVCQVRGECLEYALKNHETLGVWGGTTERTRRAIRKLRKGTELESTRFSRRRQRVLDGMWKRARGEHYTGTITEMSEFLGIKKETLLSDLKVLQLAGCIVLTDHTIPYRTWRLASRLATVRQETVA